MAMTIAMGADLSAPTVSSLMWAHASKPVMVNWDISMPTRKMYLQRCTQASTIVMACTDQTDRETDRQATSALLFPHVHSF